MRSSVAVLALFVVSIAPALAQPAQRCTRDTFPIGGQSVAVTVCAGAPDGANTVAVSETFKGPSTSFNHTSSIEVLAGAAVSRTVEDVSLAPLGMQYSLHLTLAYREAAVSIEHALLRPGPIPLK
jgi:hypothetical protein